MEVYTAFNHFHFDEELSIEEKIKASQGWRKRINDSLKEIDPSLRGQYYGNGFVVETSSKETFEKLLSQGFADGSKFRAFAEASCRYRSKNQEELDKLKKRIHDLSSSTEK